MNEVINQGGQEVIGVGRVEGPILVVEGGISVGYDEVVEILDSENHLRRGRILEVGEGMAVVEVFAGTTGLSIDGTSVRFLGGPLHIPVAEEMLDLVEHVLEDERLQEIVLRATLQRLDGRIDGRVRGHQQHECLRCKLARVREHIEAGCTRHPNIGQH